MKKLIDHLLGYCHTMPHVVTHSLGNVNVSLVGRIDGTDWGILSDFSHGLHGTEGIIITWSLLLGETGLLNAGYAKQRNRTYAYFTQQGHLLRSPYEASSTYLRS